jgi:hypothetical protein
MPNSGPAFDVNAARQAGYSDAEILQHLTQSRNFDVQGALKSGYSTGEIIDHLSATPLLTVPDAAAQAHAEMQNAIPTMAASESADYPGAQKGLSPFTTAGKREAALGEGYSDYMKQSGEFAGTVAGAMATGGLSEGPGALKLLGRSAATGVGAGTGAFAGGATPTEAAETGGMAAVSQPVAEAIGAVGSKLLSPKAAPAASSITDEWRKINDAIGVKANAIRIGENATDLSQAATMPGRALAKVGLTSDQLAKMTPLEQQQAIAPVRQQAASDLNRAFQEATDAGTKFDVGKSAFDVFKNIKGPGQQKAIDAFNDLAQEVGITNQRQATPLEARELRQALSYGARFGQGGDLSSLASIRAELYRAVNRDLHGTVPGLQDLDQFFSDVKAAGQATRNSVAKMATQAPEPVPTAGQKALKLTKQVLPWLPGLASGGYALRGALRDLLGPPAP